MATTPPLSDESFVLTAPAVNAQYNDPFNSVGPTHHRFSNFDAQLFALGPNASPAQAKRALEAHLAETDRRMEEAGKLGTALVQQRNELTERLKEVEKLQAEGELSDDLRQKLVEIERDYNEVARDSARAFLPKSRVPSNEAAAGSPFALEGKGGKRSVSPSKFEAQATASPTKLSVPNRKIRNQPSNRIHDIEFAAEISTSLIAQVRNLQGLLAEREEELKDTRAENSKLEYEVEGFQQRLKALDDNEHRYKDENWNLETQIHELMAKEREAADREKKLTQALNILQSEKNAGQRELDEIKLSHSKLVEEHTAAVKHHDIELGTAKRTMVMGESERAAMQKKIEELTGQNTELAKAVSVSIRGRKLERETIMGMSEDDFQTARDSSTPDQSPPPSPVKGTPRHSMLESETLKTSLAHAQRTIQSLRTNVHREKTEKMETRRLLQEARDEIEKMRSEPVVPTRRARKTESREFKRPPPRLLGGLRSARSEIFLDDPNWEDQSDILPHPSSSPISRERTMLFDPVPEQSEHFETANETANETSDAAFETANEHAMETDDFQTGAEEFTSDDAETETESPLKRRTLKGRPPNLFPLNRTGSIDSTASTEDEDFPYGETRTPPSLPPIHARFPLRVSRGAFRRSRNASEDQIFQSSPASLPTSSNMGTPQQHVQSLAAELGDFDGSDNESTMSATPSRRSTRGRTMSPPPALPPLPKIIMVDSGMMTEPVHELSASLKDAVSADRPLSMHTVVSRFSLGSEYSDVGAKLAEFPSPPTASPKREVALPELALSTVHSHDVEPRPEPDTHSVEMAALRAEHEEQLNKLTAENAAAHAAAIALESLKTSHLQQIDNIKSSITAAHTEELELLRAAHAKQIEDTKNQLTAAQAVALASLSDSHQKQLDDTKNSLHAAHAQELDNAALARELDTLKAEHAHILGLQVEEGNATVTRKLDALKAEHELILESHVKENAAERDYLLASHAAELEALRANLTVVPPALGYSPLSSIETEPIEMPELRSPRREAFIIPQDKEPMTPHARSNGRLDRQHKSMDVPFIAEDDTRQSPSAIVRSETPDSQQPFKEITTNTDGRSLRKPVAITSHQGSQTTLTADGLDRLMKNQRHQVGGLFDEVEAITPSTVRRRRPSTDSFGSPVRANAASEPISIRRPGSSASTRSATQNMPPLPVNHREVIEAARSHSAHGSKGAMGPPLLPASAYRPSSSRSHTPSNRSPLSPSPSSVIKSTLTPRAGKTHGYADVQSSTRMPMRSRQSSISSFASEIDTRFNIHNGMGMDPSGFGSNTDPRMIQAVTQTMIGEYLWKYTRKTGRGEMSENRHRRFFWVHPYTRALYWSDSDPAAGGRGEMRAKSVPIEAVRVVADDNPMPPGLHRKSLIVIAPGRTVKFTCTTGQRHETWFNALSYLLLRSGNEGKQDAEEVTGNITQDDVDEFNPSIHRRSENGQRPRPPPSLSSYNSRTTRNESPAMDTSMSIPTLTPTHEKEAARNGTFGKKLSGYWKSGSLSRGTFSSLRNRSYQPYDSAIYEASEVPDSAEDLRQIIEQQDRESDRLENVRACCDGKTP
ncbi:anucleate primary sterigmata protein A [Xylaria flabelliformis]|nr:anucleate primary sterigmata protein A [Xylaria flabelliformis]